MIKMGFQTARKSRLRQGMSYPVGSEILKGALADVPQFSEVVLDFYCGISRLDAQLYLITVEYNPNGIGFGLENKWCIAVCAVPSPLKSSIRKLLEESGFLHIRKWLVHPRPPSWFDAWKRLIIEYDPKSRILLYKEDGKL